MNTLTLRRLFSTATPDSAGANCVAQLLRLFHAACRRTAGPSRTYGTGAILLSIALLFTGCAALQPGADPVVVRAEQAVQAAETIFDAFLSLEHRNRALFTASLPEIHEFAEGLRKTAPAALVSARTMTKTYKAARTRENGDALAVELSVLDGLYRETQEWIARTKLKQ